MRWQEALPVADEAVGSLHGSDQEKDNFSILLESCTKRMVEDPDRRQKPGSHWGFSWSGCDVEGTDREQASFRDCAATRPTARWERILRHACGCAGIHFSPLP